MTPRTSPTAPSWLCHDVTVSPGPRSHSSVSAMDEAYTDDDTDDEADDDIDDDKDDDARWIDNSFIKI